MHDSRRGHTSMQPKKRSEDLGPVHAKRHMAPVHCSLPPAKALTFSWPFSMLPTNLSSSILSLLPLVHLTRLLILKLLKLPATQNMLTVLDITLALMTFSFLLLLNDRAIFIPPSRLSLIPFFLGVLTLLCHPLHSSTFFTLFRIQLHT
jgi:hypothetical protein